MGGRTAIGCRVSKPRMPRRRATLTRLGLGGSIDRRCSSVRVRQFPAAPAALDREPAARQFALLERVVDRGQSRVRSRIHHKTGEHPFACVTGTLATYLVALFLQGLTSRLVIFVPSS